jgi:hypothetical protein
VSTPAPAPAPARDAEVAALRAEAARLAREVEGLRDAVALLEAEAAAGSRAISRVEGTTTLGDALAARGLRGKDEMAAALRALLEARRAQELLDVVAAGTAEEVGSRIAGRVVLLSEGEAVPPGMVAVRVPLQRSESPEAPAVRAAASRLATACLLHGVTEVVFVGGMVAHQRVVRAAIDPRVHVRFVGAATPVRSGVRVEWPAVAGGGTIVAAIEAAARAVEGK